MENDEEVKLEDRKPGGSASYVVAGLVLLAILAGGYVFITNAGQSKSLAAGQGTENITQTQVGTSVSQPEQVVLGDTTTSVTVTPVSPVNGIIEVEGGEYFYKPNVIKVKKGTKVTVKYANSGGIHDFVLDEFNVSSGKIKAGETTEFSFTPDKTGTFEFYCSVGSHRAMGMRGS